jgi:hypothetical protein
MRKEPVRGGAHKRNMACKPMTNSLGRQASSRNLICSRELSVKSFVCDARVKMLSVEGPPRIVSNARHIEGLKASNHQHRRLWTTERQRIADVAAGGGWRSTKTMKLYQGLVPASPPPPGAPVLLARYRSRADCPVLAGGAPHFATCRAGASATRIDSGHARD